MKHEDQLINARRAALLLVPLASDEPEIEASALILTRADHGELIADLIDQFARLDAAEQRQNEARARNARGQSASGRKAGPKLKGKKPATSTLRSRKSRARKREAE